MKCFFSYNFSNYENKHYLLMEKNGPIFTKTKDSHIGLFKTNIPRIVRYSLRLEWNFRAICDEERNQAKHTLFKIKFSPTLHPLTYKFVSFNRIHSPPDSLRFQQREKSFETCKSAAQKHNSQNNHIVSDNPITWRDLTPMDREVIEARRRSRHVEGMQSYHTSCLSSAWQLSLSCSPRMTVLFWYQNELVTGSRHTINLRLWVAYFGT